MCSSSLGTMWRIGWPGEMTPPGVKTSRPTTMPGRGAKPGVLPGSDRYPDVKL